MSLSSTILICGAGVSGLVLAQGLLNSHIPFHIFERDISLSIRAQGYRVRVGGIGIAALKETLSPELFSRVVATCAHTTIGSTHLDALTGQKVDFGLGPPPSEGAEPLTIDRTVLRNVLTRGLEEHIEFGKDFLSYEISPTGVTVRFSDGSEVRGALLVGADGARSRVRKQFLPEYGLVDTEGRCIFGKTKITSELVESFEEKALKCLTLVKDLSHEVPLNLLLEPIRFKDNEYRSELPNDYVYWVLVSRKDHVGINEVEPPNASENAAAALALKLTSHWHPSFQALFKLQNAGQTSLIPLFSARPEIPIWEPSGCVTLIVDAAHLMSPSAAAGATTAFRDAATLTQLLRDEGIQAQSIGKYEQLMREYAGDAISRSFMGGKHLFNMRTFEELRSITV